LGGLLGLLDGLGWVAAIGEDPRPAQVSVEAVGFRLGGLQVFGHSLLQLAIGLQERGGFQVRLCTERGGSGGWGSGGSGPNLDVGDLQVKGEEG